MMSKKKANMKIRMMMMIIFNNKKRKKIIIILIKMEEFKGAKTKGCF